MSFTEVVPADLALNFAGDAGTALMLHEADLSPADAVMVTFPAFRALTLPSLLTVAMLSFEDVHVTVRSSAYAGATSAVSWRVLPHVSFAEVSLMLTDSAPITFSFS